ncbi:hypothetical protein [Clostridium omnivorum]|uniref:Transcriptional regulator n=1 Tax=Clostridium omnivorum TaxID=1604902 RepID=A0ABQ5N4Q3_9CLOT|nr:hypothetical protein [Clostridium sp. E14]GLC30213.1 hypothetical protein bsdE14_16230 [Clostridium sp. E14]
MNREFNEYINMVINYIGIRGRKEREIREDLLSSLIEKQQITRESDPYILLGEPEEIAAEFRENLGIVNDTRNYYRPRYGYGYEYVSKTKIFGLPLFHMNCKPMGVAKGIFSFGSIAVGVFSFGAISVGVFSFGAVSLGIILAIAGAAFSGLLSAGGIAISYGLSIGGLAIAKYIAVGGYASADIAIGGVAKGIVSVFQQHGTGQYMFKAPASEDQVMNAVKQVHPNLGKTLLSLIRSLL